MSGIQILDGFELRGKINLDKRERIQTASQLPQLKESNYPEGFIVYAEREDAYFKYSSKNASTGTLGRWRQVMAGDTPAYVDETEHVLHL